MVLLAIAASAIAPAWGQNSTTYNVTFSGFFNSNVNITHEDQTLPHQFTFGKADIASDISAIKRSEVTTSAGKDEIQLSNNDDNLFINVTAAFEGTATINVKYWDGEDNVRNINVTVSCVAAAPPQPHTVRFAAGTEEAANWTLASGNASVPGTQALENVMSGSTLIATYNGDLKVKEVIATKHQEPTPLTIEALTAGNVVVQNPQSGMQYTLNGGAKTAMTESPTVITVAVGDKVQLYGDGTSITSYGGTVIGGGYDGTAEVKVYGNIMSLVNETGFDTATTLTGDHAFHSLFEGYFNLNDISGLKLPATTLTEGCYDGMFSYCTGLTTVPSDLLPATTLAMGCYAGMFGGCENLTTVPTLPATTLAMGCYNNMFSFCTGLITVPTDLLPATTLAIDCYSHMFHFCPNLTTAPVLPATTLVASCYLEMFSSCYKLSSVTCLATSGINQDNSTEFWLDRAGSSVQGTKTFNAVSTAEWPEGNSNGIPSGWTRQNIDN